MCDIEYGHHISYKNYFKIILIYLIILLPIALIRFPDIRNEIKYFLVADNLLETKKYFVLKYFSELYPDKPPLYLWLLGVLKTYFNNNYIEISVILGSLIPSFLITTFSYSLFSKIKDEKTGFAVALSLCSVPFFMGTSVFLRMDMLMSFFIFMSLYKFFNLYYNCIKNNLYNRMAIYFYIFLAVFTKGPAGFAVPVATILIFLVLEKNIKFLKNIHFLKGILFIVMLIGLWLYCISLEPQGKDYISLLLGRETVGRMLKSKTHIEPFYYYFERIILLIYPYGIIFLASVLYYFKNIRIFYQWEPLEKIGFAWTVVPFILFSLASGKLEIYLLPLFPGMILLGISFILKLENQKTGNIILKISSILTVFGVLLNKIFNREQNYYKKILFIPAGILIPFIIVSYSMSIYNNNFTLKPVINKIQNEKNVAAYRFPDFLNTETFLKKTIIQTENTAELETQLNNSDNLVIVSRNKYADDLKDFNNLNLIYKNKMYSLYEEQKKTADF